MRKWQGVACGAGHMWTVVAFAVGGIQDGHTLVFMHCYQVLHKLLLRRR